MRIVEKVLGVLIMLSLFMKFNLWVGGMLLAVLSFSMLSFLYYPLGFALINGLRFRDAFKKESFKSISTRRIVGGVATGFVLSHLLIAILFKIQYWPGADLMLKTSLISAALLLLISLVRFLKNKDAYYTRIFKRISIIGGFALFLFVVPDLTIVQLQFRNHPKYIEAFEEFQSSPNNKEAQKNLRIEYRRATMSQEEFEMHMKYDGVEY